MTEMTQQQLEQAVDDNWEAVADEVFDDDLEAQIRQAAKPAAFRIDDSRLKAASLTAANALPVNLRLAALAGSNASWAAVASDGAKTVDPGKVVEEADGEKRQAAAEGVRDYICGRLRDWFDEHIEQLKTWLDELGIKATIKKLAEKAKELVLAAIGSIAAAIGSTFLAYLLIGVAVAAVGAAIYFAVKKGLPNYCAV